MVLKLVKSKNGKPVIGTVGQAASRVKNYSQNLLLIGTSSLTIKN